MATHPQDHQAVVAGPGEELQTHAGSNDGAREGACASDEHFRLIVENLPALLFTSTASGEIEYTNAHVLQYFGRSNSELKSWRPADAVHPDDLERVTGEWHQEIRSTQHFETELRLRRADGMYRWFHLRLAPGRDPASELMRWYGIAFDVDEMKRAVDTSPTNARALTHLLDSIPALVFTTTATGELEWVNRTIREYFGTSLDELRDWQMTEAVHPDDLQNTITQWRLGVESAQPYEFEHRLHRFDGVYRWFQFRAAPLHDDDGRLVRWCGLVTDIDDLKRAEEGLRNVQSRLSRAGQLAAVSELAASIAHEVNQPLAAVVVNGHACHRWLSATPPSVERALLSAERIIRDGNSAADVVARVRALFRHAQPIKQHLNLNEVIEEVCRLAADELRNAGITLRLELQPDLPAIGADRVQMQQVLANVARNGIEAMQGVQGRARELTITSQVCGHEILVRVTDVGDGLRDLNAVFEPFYSTKAGGMGMGLAICKSIMEAHGGRLWATPNVAHGATFGFALPVAEAESR
jgi:PAS domain S-box-containing protein